MAGEGYNIGLADKAIKIVKGLEDVEKNDRKKILRVAMDLL